MAAHILDKHKRNVGGLELLPSTGGPFEVTVGGRLVFSKRQLGRFPNEGEAEALVDEALAGAAAPR